MYADPFEKNKATGDRSGEDIVSGSLSPQCTPNTILKFVTQLIPHTNMCSYLELCQVFYMKQHPHLWGKKTENTLLEEKNNKKTGSKWKYKDH